MQTVVLVLGVVFTGWVHLCTAQFRTNCAVRKCNQDVFTTTFFFATADEHKNYYSTEDDNIGTRREGEYYDAYPGNEILLICAK